jgi:hypothetical protein
MIDQLECAGDMFSVCVQHAAEADRFAPEILAIFKVRAVARGGLAASR